jgi:tetratricopeptide (TPR) repeat protein
MMRQGCSTLLTIMLVFITSLITSFIAIFVYVHYFSNWGIVQIQWLPLYSSRVDVNQFALQRAQDLLSIIELVTLIVSLIGFSGLAAVISVVQQRQETITLQETMREQITRANSLITQVDDLNKVFKSFTLLQLGARRQQSGNMELASRAFRDAGEALNQFEDPVVSYFLGDAYLWSHQYERALTALERGIALDPKHDYPELRAVRGYVYGLMAASEKDDSRRRALLRKAENRIRIVLKKHGKLRGLMGSSIHSSIAEVYAELGKTDKALKSFKDAQAFETGENTYAKESYYDRHFAKLHYLHYLKENHESDMRTELDTSRHYAGNLLNYITTSFPNNKYAQVDQILALAVMGKIREVEEKWAVLRKTLIKHPSHDQYLADWLLGLAFTSKAIIDVLKDENTKPSRLAKAIGDQPKQEHMIKLLEKIIDDIYKFTDGQLVDEPSS